MWWQFVDSGHSLNKELQKEIKVENPLLHKCWVELNQFPMSQAAYMTENSDFSHMELDSLLLQRGLITLISGADKHVYADLF